MRVTTPPATEIMEVAERGGGPANLRGIVIDVKEGSGLIFRCPLCERLTHQDVCRLHGKVKPTPDLRLKMVLDDGTGALTVLAGREITENVMGKTLDECLSIARDHIPPSSEVIRALQLDLLLAHPVRVKGKVARDDFGLLLEATAGEVVDTEREQVEED